jgi:hypothetical protein
MTDGDSFPLNQTLPIRGTFVVFSAGFAVVSVIQQNWSWIAREGERGEAPKGAFPLQIECISTVFNSIVVRLFDWLGTNSR